MPSPRHEAYHASVVKHCQDRADDDDFVEQLKHRAAEALVLWHLDLEPARTSLEACYADSPRGGRPRDPVVMLRCLLLMLLVGQPSLNKWAAALKASRVLRILAGLDPEARPPGVGTFYDFLHRLHDGPSRGCCEHAERPSELERRRARTPTPRKRRGKKKAKRRRDTTAEEVAVEEAKTVTARVVAEIARADALDNPNDLLGRLSAMLLDVAVVESARRGLLGDLDQLVVGGDGSPLRTGAHRYGKRKCDHRLFKRCDCARVYSDPDAAWGWDNHRKQWFFGHHFYEISCSTSGHDLPLALRLDPGNTSDYTASLHAFTRLRKDLRARSLPWTLDTFIADAGHDAEPIHRHLVEHGVKPIIPLKAKARATHPTRPDLLLSGRGVPLCKAGVEMAHWGSAGKGRTAFICPIRAGKLARCPLAPEGQPDWHCRPDLKWGPTKTVAVRDNPRLFPAVPRNSARYARLYTLRSGTERSNAVKKTVFGLERARHRRASFWLIRLHLISILQHARAWVASEAAEPLLDHLLGRDGPPLEQAA